MFGDVSVVDAVVAVAGVVDDVVEERVELVVAELPEELLELLVRPSARRSSSRERELRWSPPRSFSRSRSLPRSRSPPCSMKYLRMRSCLWSRDSPSCELRIDSLARPGATAVTIPSTANNHAL